jgi:hypothetical protein
LTHFYRIETVPVVRLGRSVGGKGIPMEPLSSTNSSGSKAEDREGGDSGNGTVPESPLSSIYVIGDAGRDIFTFNHESRDDASPESTFPASQSVFDIAVPSGAAFMQTFLAKVFGPFTGVHAMSTLVSKASMPDALPSIGLTLAHVKPFGSGGQKAYRIWTHERLEHMGRTPPEVEFVFDKMPPERPDTEDDDNIRLGDRLLLIYDAHHHWQNASRLLVKQKALVDRFKQSKVEADLKFPSILIDLNNSLPELEADAEDGGRPRFKDLFWQHLSRKHLRSDVGVVVSVSTIRRAGGAISRRLSLEQVVEDLTADLHFFPELRALSRFGHLFIRLGMVAVIHVRNVEGRLSGEVHFAPYAKDGIHRDGEVDGHVAGRNTMLMAALVRQIQRFGRMLEEPRTRLYGNDGNDRTLLSRLGDRLPGTFRKGFGAAAALAYRIAIRNGLTAIIEADNKGYARDPFAARPSPGVPDDDGPSDKAGIQLIEQLATFVAPLINRDEVAERPTAEDDDSPGNISVKVIPTYLLEGPLPGERRTLKRWRILDEVLEDSPVHRINVAMAIVMGGHRQVFNRAWHASDGHDEKTKEVDKALCRTLTRVEWWSPRDRSPDFVTLPDGDRPAMPDASRPTTAAIIGDNIRRFDLNVPIMKFNQLVVAERDEIEGIRSISNILKIYLREKSYNQPISIAVFGPPGSGKSFAVKEIGSVIDPKKQVLHNLEFNVAQFAGTEELAVALNEVSGKAHERVPLTFFDEFDCAYNGQPLGWLKYFLAPMQDGNFYLREAKKTIPIGRAIFVFAGGIHSTFERFDPRIVAPDEEGGLTISEEHKARVRLFKEQKGPDFISRLRGHINVLPINTEPGRTKHFIRRAIQLRSILDRRGHLTRHKLAAVDRAVIYALLTVDRYRHGVRSMEAIVQMCTRLQGTIEIASLPSRAQLNMHVDADEFLVRVHRGRQRENWEWQEPDAHGVKRHEREARIAEGIFELAGGAMSPNEYLDLLVDEMGKMGS